MIKITQTYYTVFTLNLRHARTKSILHGSNVCIRFFTGAWCELCWRPCNTFIPSTSYTGIWNRRTFSWTIMAISNSLTLVFPCSYNLGRSFEVWLWIMSISCDKCSSIISLKQSFLLKSELCGTPGYLAPEILKCSMDEMHPGYGKEVDLWVCLCSAEIYKRATSHCRF